MRIENAKDDVIMIWRSNSESMRRFAMLCTVILIGAVGTACDDDHPIMLEQGHELVVMEQGINAYLVVSSDEEGSGSTIEVEARVRAVGEDLSPTAFLANLRYDSDYLEPVTVIPQDDDVVRAINLEYAPGIIKAAGASADGLGTEIMVAVTMKVKKAGYMTSLSIDLDELTVLEKDFSDVTHKVQSIDEPILFRTAIIEKVKR
jgi:hypothetical protein